MMNNVVDEQIVRLVKEIAEDEKKIAKLRKDASETYVDDYRKRYTEQAEHYEAAVNRKLKLLSILKG